MRFSVAAITALCVMSSGMAQTYLSPCDLQLAKDGQTVHLLAATGRQLLDFDLRTRKVSRSLPLPGEPTGMTMSADGETLYVAGGGYEGRIWTVTDNQLTGEIHTGHTPMSPVLSPDGTRIYVCNRFDNDVSFIDLASGDTVARVPVVREPVAADITPDGKRLFVANHIPDGRADVDYVASRISVIDTETREAHTIALVNGAEGMRGLKVSSDGRKVYATHQVARYLVPTTQLERGWVSTDALSVIDVESRTLEYTVLLDDIDRGFPNPWAIGFSADGNTLVVSSAGNHELSLINLPAMQAKIREAMADPNGADTLKAHNDLSFLTGIRKRIRLQGLGPRSLAVEGDRIYVGSYFSDALEVIRFTGDWKTESVILPLCEKQPLTPERQGEIYFNDGALCFQNWLSCATCHPDARTDGMNWDLLNDGMGNPKNVKSMLLAHRTPRAMWLGVRADAEAGVRAGIRHIQFAVRPEEDAKAIDAYLKSLEPVPSPYLVDGKLSTSALRGKNFFDQAGCVHCHPPPLFTNLEMVDIGTTQGLDEGFPVDVPQLVEVWRTAPYLHDGRAATIKDVLTIFKHGRSGEALSKLSEEQIDDLVEYILSL